MADQIKFYIMNFDPFFHTEFRELIANICLSAARFAGYSDNVLARYSLLKFLFDVKRYIFMYEPLFLLHRFDDARTHMSQILFCYQHEGIDAEPLRFSALVQYVL